MPREKINHAALFEPRTDAGSGPEIHGESWPEPEVHIGWTCGVDHGPGFVQVSVDCPRAYILNLAEELRREPTQDSIGVFSPALVRDDVNALIRTSRRARDQAYGRDE